MKQNKRFSPLALLLSALGGAVLALAATALSLYLIFGPQLIPLASGLRLIREQFVAEYDPGLMTDAALTGMVYGLEDRWSHYLTKEEWEAQKERRTNSYSGIGVTVTMEDERGPVIVQVQEGSPAAQAGLEADSIILAVDGTSMAGEARYECSQFISGPDNTQVLLTILSPDGTEREVSVTRKHIQVETAVSQMLGHNVGYVQLRNFYDHSADALEAEVNALLEQGAQSFVFDMRNNGGGYLSQLKQMLDFLLPEGPIFRSVDNRGNEEITESDADCIDLPMAVLVNADTYSAAEFFAAQLQESVDAPIIGVPTSGKGYSQQIFPVEGAGAMNISTGRYLTGSGVSLVGTGVTLDREVSLTEEQDQALRQHLLKPEDDPQLQAALELLGGS